MFILTCFLEEVAIRLTKQAKILNRSSGTAAPLTNNHCPVVPFVFFSSFAVAVTYILVNRIAALLTQSQNR